MSTSVTELELVRDEPLSRHTSVRVGGPADLFVVAKGSRVLQATVELARERGLPFLVLGSGSNVVMADAGYRGLVIRSLSRGVEVRGEDDLGIVVELEGGTYLPSAAKQLASQGIAGLEWGVGIPGTAGGAVVGNAGAYGGVTAETLTEIDVVDSWGNLLTIPAEALRFEYRSSAIKRSELDVVVVLRARYRLHRDDPDVINARIQHFLAERKRKQPVEPSVGSTFKNPEGAHAGILIESLGLKGTKVGGAMISPKHANYVINTGNATAADIRELVEKVRTEVYELTGIRLETEIEFKGAW